MKRIIFSIVFAMPFFAGAMNVHIKQKQIFAPTRLGDLSLIKSEQGFSVIKDNVEQKVHSYDVDPVLRSLSNEQLAKALQASRIKVTQLSNEDYKLDLHAGLKGGGIICAAFAYTTVHIFGWGSAAVVATTAVVGTGGVATGAVAVQTALALPGTAAAIESAAVSAAVIFSVPWLP